MIERVLGLVITGGWALVWLVATGMAIWQILRGRAFAGICLGAAALTGFGILVAQSLLPPVWQMLSELAGYEVTAFVRSLTFGTLDGLVIALLLGAAVLQRPPKENG